MPKSLGDKGVFLALGSSQQHADRWLRLIGKFLLVFYSYLRSKYNRCRVIASYLTTVAYFNPSYLHLAPSLVYPFEFRWDIGVRKRVLGLSCGVLCVILSSAVSVDVRTDGQTDGRTHDDSIYRASIASRGKMYGVILQRDILIIVLLTRSIINSTKDI